MVLVVGDSLSTAHGFDTDAGWTSLLGQRLAEKGHPHRVVNASVTGDTTRGGLARLPRALRLHEPSLVIIELGGNDGLRGYPLEQMRDNLAAMIEMSQARGARVVLVGVTIPPNYGPDYTGGFRAVYDSLAGEYGVLRVELDIRDVAGEQGMLQDDGIHPTARAQPRILDIVWPAVSGALAR